MAVGTHGYGLKSNFGTLILQLPDVRSLVTLWAQTTTNERYLLVELLAAS